MYKKILAPLDGSEFSECSLRHVKAIALGCHTPEVILLRVVEPTKSLVEVDEDLRARVEDSIKTATQDYLSKKADELKREGLATQTAVVAGKPEEEIIDYATNNRADLIIMSTHGRSGITRWAAGSVSDRVARYSPVPVMLVSPAGCKTK